MFKKYKKGFTLIETVITIGLLAIIAVIIIININKNLKNQQVKEYAEFVEKIKSATNVYMSVNPDAEYIVKTDYGYNVISLERIEEAGLINMDNLIDPETNLSLSELPDDSEKKYVKIYADDKSGNEKSDATLIEYPASGINDLYRYLKYEMNGYGSCVPNPQAVLVNSKISLCAPTDNNATFAGWYLENEMINKVVLDSKNEYKPLESRSFYAKWYKNKKSEIKNITITSGTSNYLDSIVNVKLSVYDVYGGTIKICINNNPNISSCTLWKEITISKGGTSTYNETINLSKYSSRNTTGSGNSVRLYAFALNTAYEEAIKDERNATSLIEIKYKDYQIYKYCNDTVVGTAGTWGACDITCTRDNKKGNRTRTDSLIDAHYKSITCGTKTVTGQCENLPDCCDESKLVVTTDYGACDKACGGGTRVVTKTYTSGYDKSFCKSETNTQSCNNQSCCGESRCDCHYWQEGGTTTCQRCNDCGCDGNWNYPEAIGCSASGGGGGGSTATNCYLGGKLVYGSGFPCNPYCYVIRKRTNECYECGSCGAGVSEVYYDNDHCLRYYCPS